MVKPTSGTVKLPTGTLGQTIAHFRDWLNAKVVSEGITHIAVESIFLKHPSAAPRLYGLNGIVHETVYRRGMTVHEIVQSEWRGRFLGKVSPPKGMAPADRRKWWKQKAKDACAERGWDVATDDEADACGVLVFERARLLPEFSADDGLFVKGA